MFGRAAITLDIGHILVAVQTHTQYFKCQGYNGLADQIIPQSVKHCQNEIPYMSIRSVYVRVQTMKHMQFLYTVTTVQFILCIIKKTESSNGTQQSQFTREKTTRLHQDAVYLRSVVPLPINGRQNDESICYLTYACNVSRLSISVLAAAISVIQALDSCSERTLKASCLRNLLRFWRNKTHQKIHHARDTC